MILKEGVALLCVRSFLFFGGIMGKPRGSFECRLAALCSRAVLCLKGGDHRSLTLHSLFNSYYVP